MDIEVQSISSAPFIPLSASYGYDDKITLNPTFFQYEDGYSFFHHPMLQGAKDVSFANESFFAITSASNLMSLIDAEVQVDPSALVLFTGLSAPNGKLITNINNTLYATATSLGPSEFFRIIHNDDNTYSITQSGLYATVDLDNNLFNIRMQEKIEPDTTNIQKFDFYTGGSDREFNIMAKFTVPEWVAFFPDPIERFWSFYDSDNNIIRANGVVADDDYATENPYLFTATVDLQLFSIGFDGKVVWVKYYTEFIDKSFNKSVDIQNVIEGVYQNYLIDYPYKTKTTVTNFTEGLSGLKTGQIKVNLMNLKNIMTPEYNYHLKSRPDNS